MAGVELDRRPDVYVAVMGMTGTGKSTFISQCTNEGPKIGYALQSCTQEVQVFESHLFADVKLHLIDTPGFDDSHRTDTQVLKEIANWMTKSFGNGTQLQGILYLHRISDVRMGRTQMRNLLLFRQICGRDALKNVWLVTTMWDRTMVEDGERRERELMSTEEHWGYMMKNGSRTVRHYNNETSAMNILAQLMPGYCADPPLEIPLAIQTEMVHDNKHLDETGAGKELQKDFSEQSQRVIDDMRERERQLQEARIHDKEAHDREFVEFMEREQKKSKEDLQALVDAQEALKVDLQRMHEEKLYKLQKDLEEQQQLNLQNKAQLSTMEINMGTNQREWQDERERYNRQIHSLSQQVQMYATTPSQLPSWWWTGALPSQPQLPTTRAPQISVGDEDNSDGESNYSDDSDDSQEYMEAWYIRLCKENYRAHFKNTLDYSRWAIKIVSDDSISPREDWKWRGQDVKKKSISGLSWAQRPSKSREDSLVYFCKTTDRVFLVTKESRASRGACCGGSSYRWSPISSSTYKRAEYFNIHLAFS